jgi:hypothetical protein
MLEPDRLGISADSGTAVSQLNDWLERCAEKATDGAALGADIQKLLQPVLSRPQLNRLSSGRFVEGDGEHVRNCLLHKVLANLDFESAETALGRSVEVFHYITRNISHAPGSGQTLPLPPYEILLLGRGTAKDIAWVFADVLRQLKIDTVILSPSGSVAGETASTAKQRRWLVGVLLDGQVYLFDPQIGSPIPSLLDTGQTPTVQRPATLAEVLKDDQVLRRLDFSNEQPYPLHADDLRQLKVEVVGTTSSWSSSMQSLQAVLSGNWSAIVYDGLQDGTDTVGLIARVASFGGQYWGKDDVAVWQYPESQLEAFKDLDETQRQLLALWQLPLAAPVTVTYNAQTQQVAIGRPENGQLKTRTMDLLGDYPTAIGNFLNMRLRAQINPQLTVPPEIRLMHALAEDNAFFWMGLSQFELGNLQSATSTFRGYLRRYARQPNAAWPAHCRTMLALSLAESGEVSAAVDELKNELKEADPAAQLRGRYQFWIHRWSAIQVSPRNDEK